MLRARKMFLSELVKGDFPRIEWIIGACQNTELDDVMKLFRKAYVRSRFGQFQY